MGLFLPIFLIISSYLLGSIPNALIVSKTFKGVDIRDYGSKNMGATNVNRVMGFKYGIIVFIFDAIKAGLIVFLFTSGLLDWDVDWLVFKINPLFYGLIAILGHMFPIFAGFKGGKGVACCTGIILAYEPLLFLIAFIVFVLVLIWKKYISLSSIISVIIAFALSFLFKNDGELDYYLIITLGVITLFIIIRHIPNIKRLIKGTESKFTIKKI